MNAIYTTREGQNWEVEDLVPSLFFPGFLTGRRKDTGALVHVHEHRLRYFDLEAVSPVPTPEIDPS